MTATRTDKLGFLETLTGLLGEEMTESGGFRLTRTNGVIHVGDTTFTVETTLDWPAAGKVALDGVVYHYASKTDTTLVGITHVAAGSSVPGARIDHRDASAVMDIAGSHSFLEQLRNAVAVDTAVAEDLSVVGSNIAVPRLPMLHDDGTYRAIIKALAYNPRGTMLGLRLALDALLGAGNYEISEDLVNNPCVVYVGLLGALLVTDEYIARTYLETAEDAVATASGVVLP